MKKNQLLKEEDIATPIRQMNTLTTFVSEVSRHHGWSDAPVFDLRQPDWQEIPALTNENARFFRITEISAEEEAVLRQDLENVISSLGNQDFRWVYLIVGTLTGIELYVGVVQSRLGLDVHDHGELLRSQFEGNFTGAKLEPVRAETLETKILSPFNKSDYAGLLCGVPSRTIDQQSSNGAPVTQGIDRLANSLLGQEWQLLIVAEPADKSEVNRQLHQLLQLSSDLHPHIKMSKQDSTNQSKSVSTTEGTGTSRTATTTDGENKSFTRSEGSNEGETRTTGKSSGANSGTSSGSYTQTSSGKNWGTNSSTAKTTGTNDNKSWTTGTNTGTSEAQGYSRNASETIADTEGAASSSTAEYLNKKLERIQQHINETLIERFDLGRSKGMFRTAVYLAAPTQVIYDRLSRGMISIFQGNQSHFTPLNVQPLALPERNKGQYLLTLQQVATGTVSQELALVHSIPYQDDKLFAATWLNTCELALLAGLPSREVPGICLRKNVDFAVNAVNPVEGFELGLVVQHGRILKGNPIRLDKKLLNQHIFISGVTGAGKTTTCQQILMMSGLPFLVIEPAKTEYRTLSALDKNIQFYTLGNEDISPFRFNPFELLPKERLSGHIDMLKATFSAVFPMEAAMPYMVEEAIVRSYEKKGWDIHLSENFDYPDPWKCGGQCWPIMSEMLFTLKEVIKSKKLGRELQEKYEGSLIARLDNLTVGTKGRMLNTRNSIDVEDLLNHKVVIELEELRDEQDKALMMGLLIGRIAEAVKQRHKRDNNFQHLTLLEEAHRLLAKPQPGDDGAKRHGVDLFTNLLAEVRKYGEGLIIADQIPNKLTPEVMKNTNTKIVHRLFAADDRHAIGDTIGLIDEQKDYLTLLQTGEAVVYSAGWHEAVRVKVHLINNTNAADIAESDMERMGAHRLWMERSRLYPRLAAQHKWLETDFKNMLQQGLRCLNLCIRWVKSPNEHHGKLIQAAMAKLKADYSAVPTVQLLVSLFMDAAPLAFAERKIQSATTIEQVVETLLQLSDRGALPITLKDYEALGHSERDWVKDLNVLFVDLTSI